MIYNRNNTDFNESELKKLGWFPLLEKVRYVNYYMSDINWVSKLNPKVKECSVSGSGFNKMDLKALNDTSLEFIIFTRLNIDDFSVVTDNQTIREIYAWCYDGESLDGIENFRSLETLYLADAHDLADCSALKECGELKSLSIIQCDMTNDYSCVLDIPKLEYLQLDKDTLSDEQVKTLTDRGVEVSFYDYDKKQ